MCRGLWASSFPDRIHSQKEVAGLTPSQQLFYQPYGSELHNVLECSMTASWLLFHPPHPDPETLTWPVGRTTWSGVVMATTLPPSARALGEGSSVRAQT